MKNVFLRSVFFSAFIFCSLSYAMVQKSVEGQPCIEQASVQSVPTVEQEAGAAIHSMQSSVLGNYFYATKQSQIGEDIPVAPTAVNFDIVSCSDGSWTLVDGTDFVAQESGVFLVMVGVNYLYDQVVGNDNVLRLSPYLAGKAIVNATQVFDFFSPTVETHDTPVKLDATFIVSVTKGQVLRCMTWQDDNAGTNFKYDQPTLTPGWNIGSIAIMRLK